MRKRVIAEGGNGPKSNAAFDFLAVAPLKAIIRSSSVAINTEVCRTRQAKAYEYIRRLELLLEDQPEISVTLSDLAYIVDLERTYCCKVFRSITGKSFSQWIRRIRIKKARELLRCSAHSITDISHAVGYTDITTFERNFLREVGVNPTTFRRAVPEIKSRESEWLSTGTLRRSE